MNKVMKILMIVVALIIAFILIFAVGKAAGIFKSIGSGTTTEDSSDKDTVKVPDIVGMTEEEATKALKDKNLGIKVDSREDSSSNWSGVRLWAPSHLALAGSLWTSIIRPSAPAATAALAS